MLNSTLNWELYFLKIESHVSTDGLKLTKYLNFWSSGSTPLVLGLEVCTIRSGSCFAEDQNQGLSLVVHAFNLSPEESGASLVYTVNSRTAWAT